MPLPKPPFIASADQIHIRRDGDAAIIQYADEAVATTRFVVGAEQLAAMTDDKVLELWNEMLEASDAHRRSLSFTATEVPVGQPQVRYVAESGQWVPRGDVIRCEILTDPAIEPALEAPFVAIDGRDFSLAEFMTMVGTHGGWGMRLEFVPDDELHLRPKLKVRDPDGKRVRSFTKRRV